MAKRRKSTSLPNNPYLGKLPEGVRRKINTYSNSRYSLRIDLLKQYSDDNLDSEYMSSYEGNTYVDDAAATWEHAQRITIRFLGFPDEPSFSPVGSEETRNTLMGRRVLNDDVFRRLFDPVATVPQVPIRGNGEPVNMTLNGIDRLNLPYMGTYSITVRYRVYLPEGPEREARLDHEEQDEADRQALEAQGYEHVEQRFDAEAFWENQTATDAYTPAQLQHIRDRCDAHLSQLVKAYCTLLLPPSTVPLGQSSYKLVQNYDAVLTKEYWDAVIREERATETIRKRIFVQDNRMRSLSKSETGYATLKNLRF